MRMNVSIDDELLAEAKKLTKIENTQKLVHHAIEYMASYEAVKFLKSQAGTQPNLRIPARRRMEVE